MLGCYTDLSSKKWYGILRPLQNQPISIYIDLGVARHIIEGTTHSTKPNGVRVWDEKLQWIELYSKRCYVAGTTSLYHKQFRKLSKNASSEMKH